MGSVWVRCDLSCTRCTQPPHDLYKPNNNFVHRWDPLCSAAPTSANQRRKLPRDHCPYKVRYADGSSYAGSLVTDSISLKLRSGSVLSPRLTFGCGYELSHGDTTPLPTAGILGLGKSKVSIVSQLISVSGIRNVLGHCLSAKDGGFLFLGADLVPSSNVAWVPFSSSEDYYAAGLAELLHNGKPIGVEGLQVIFDSGSTYNHFIPKAYQAVLNQVRIDLKGKPLEEVAGQGVL